MAKTLHDLEATLKAKTAEANALLKAQMEQSEKDNRVRTPEEIAAVEAMLIEARGVRAEFDRRRGDQSLTDELARLTAGLPTQAHTPRNGNGHGPRRALSLGQQFVAHEAYEYFKTGKHRSSASWRSPSMELWLPGSRLSAATLTEDPASGGALVIPQYESGIIPLPSPPLVVADLIAPGTTSSNMISFMREKTFTNAAAAVAEGALKPESTLVFEAATAPVRKLAHWLPTSEEMLEDSPQIQAYIDARLRFGLQLEEDDQLLNGDGIAPNILGIRMQPGISPPVVAGVGESNADAIYRQINVISITALVQPDGIVMHPANWGPIELSKSSTGEYLAGGPFASRVPRTLWGLNVALSMAEPSGTTTVGAFAQMSQFFRHGGVRVEASNSHADFFIRNLVAIRAEERGALAVYRPAAFGDVTGLAVVVAPAEAMAANAPTRKA